MESEGEEYNPRPQQPPPSNNTQHMAKEESRTRAVGRKRKQAPTQDLSTIGKRLKTAAAGAGSSDGENSTVASRVVSRRGSRETGEISTASSSRRTSNESSGDFPPRRHHDPSTLVAAGVPPISDGGKVVAKDQERVMNIVDVKPSPFKKHIAEEHRKAGDMSVEDLVRSCCRHGMPFRSYAVALIKEWNKSSSTFTPDISVPAELNGQSSTLDLRTLEGVLTNGQFSRDMTWDDMGTSHERYNQVIERLKAKACQLHRPDDVVGMLVDWFKRGGPSKAARKRIDKFVDENYVGAKQAGSVSGMQVKPEEQKNDSHRVDRDARVEDIERCHAADGSAESSIEHSDAYISLRTYANADDIVSVGDRTDRDYGSLARATASVQTKEASETDLWVRLGDIPESEQMIQYRYFGLIDDRMYVRCLSCGREGHMRETCSENICKHCGVINVHFSAACPTFRKCRLCRRRGHWARECRNPSVQGGGPNDPCDVCGEIGHVEEECSHLWRFCQIKDEDIVKAENMITACYNCGNMDHWGDDCPKLPSFLKDLRGNNRTWSRQHADRFLEKASTQRPSRNGIGSVDGGGRYSYQLAHLNDTRD